MRQHIISRFAIAKHFTYITHPIVNRKGVTHYTLQGKACEKEYEQIVRTPFSFSGGKTCFMEAIFSICDSNTYGININFEFYLPD